MFLEITKYSPESYTGSLTELTLGLPGQKSRLDLKRLFSNTVELNLGLLSSTTTDSDNLKNRQNVESNNDVQVLGWQPVRPSNRKNMKVVVDGAPYLRKLDLNMYRSYKEFFDVLDKMFSSLTICHLLKKRRLMAPSNSIKFVPVYEDEEGDWLLIGDIPWNMFVASCNRLRLMKSSYEVYPFDV